MLDLLIRNGRVVDWKNDVDRIADLGIKDGAIAEVGSTASCAKKTVEAEGLLVVPGIIDSHMHASGWLGGRKSFRMLAKAGVTTAMEMAGPVESVKQFMREEGTGLTIACLEQIKPGFNIGSTDPSAEEIDGAIDNALSAGAFGVKLLGGHYPLTPDASKRLLKRCHERGVYVAVHAGSTKEGSNIRGMQEIIDLAEGTPFRLCHINAYCRGSVLDLPDEIKLATELLEKHPEIDTESYLSPINGCSGKCVEGQVESGVTRNCLKAGGYSTDAVGMRKAIEDGYALVHKETEQFVELACASEGVLLWDRNKSDIPVSFKVNPAISRFNFAVNRRRNGSFLCDSFCTDGGGIPRNVIISHGLSLVRFDALSLKDFVFKSSYNAAQLLGLPNKGHFSLGADADITIIDPERQVPIHSFVKGEQVLKHEEVVGTGGTLLTTTKGVSAVEEAGLKAQESNLAYLFDYRIHRFNNK